ncbi:MAG: hypothetical protein JWQ38_1325 [Flavipsychrobacter sp.]|nr:hypothetical protein [Flavipsychrobacter sp.]
METVTKTSNDVLLDQLATFINEIGIACRSGTLSGDTFLPGVDIQQGTIIYDVGKLKYPGDLLHEAGHIAVLLAEHRTVAQSPDDLFGNIGPEAAEMAAIAWSWAAIKYLEIPPEVVFHEHGYKGGSESIMENFSNGKYFGVPMLQWMGMTKEPKRDIAADEHTFPGMMHWLNPGKNG